MEKCSTARAVACLTLVLTLGGSVARVAPTAEIEGAAQLIAFGDPAPPPPPGAYRLTDVVVRAEATTERCRPYPSPATLPATARLGEAVPIGHQLDRVSAVGQAPAPNGRVWLVADVSASEPRCAGLAQLWEFLFTATDGTIYQPAPQGRRGEFTSYDIPAGGYATGRIFFNLPPSALPGGAVGIRRRPTSPTVPATAPIEPYALWPLPPSLPSAPAPDTLPAD